VFVLLLLAWAKLHALFWRRLIAPFKHGPFAIEQVLRGVEWFAKAQAANPSVRKWGISAATLAGVALWELCKHRRFTYGALEMIFSMFALSFAFESYLSAEPYLT
jgi:hypothetical protein